MEDWTNKSFKVTTKHFDSNNDITLIPVADVHLGSLECHMKEWFKFCKWLEEQPNTYIVTIGDLLDNATKNSVGNGFEAVMRPREAKKKMVECLTPIKHKILLATGGNHERRTDKDVDQDLTYDIFSKLDLEDIYSENIGFLKIQIGQKNGNGKMNPTYMFAITHGNGSSIYTGSSAVKGERFGMAIDNIDCLMMGHTHKPLQYPIAKFHLDPLNNKVTIRQWWLIVASSWLGYAAYAAGKMLTPTARIKQWATLCGTRKEMTVSGQ